ncbi:MAG: DUF563 domain-containing protein [Lachnospiraceae bacterium]|nr:DUF563 domain-containing protein [Lachnospiraceae bacterium]
MDLIKSSLYISKDIKTWRDQAALNYENISVCNLTVVKNGYILPLKRLSAMSNESDRTYAGGVQSEEGQFVAGHKRAKDEKLNLSCCKTYTLDEKQRNEAALLERTVIYGGMVMDIFGHVMAEAFCRLWYVLEHDEEKNLIAFVAISKVPKYFYDFMELLGIDRKRIVIVNEVIKCKLIIVPEQAHIMHVGYNPKICDVYKTMMETAQREKGLAADSHGGSYKIYLSRLQFKKHDCINESYFAQFYERRGYKVVSLETLPIVEQVSMIASASDIVCTSGTLSHWLLFAQERTKITILLRCNAVRALIPQLVINQMKRSRVIMIDCSYNYLPTTHASGTFLMGPTKDFVKYLDQEGITYKQEEIQMDFEKTAWDYIYTWINNYGRNCYPYKRINKQDIFDVVNRMSEVILDKSLTRKEMATPTKASISKGELEELQKSYEKIKGIANQYYIYRNAYQILKNSIQQMQTYVLCGGERERLEELIQRRVLIYDVHFSKTGWINDNEECAVSGIPYSDRGIEAIRAKLYPENVNIEYGVYVDKIGWKYGKNGEIAGTVGESRPVIGLFLKMDEEENLYDISYRAGNGDCKTEWHRNGKITDTFGWTRIETLEIKIEPKEDKVKDEIQAIIAKINDYKDIERKYLQMIEELQNKNEQL